MSAGFSFSLPREPKDGEQKKNDKWQCLWQMEIWGLILRDLRCDVGVAPQRGNRFPNFGTGR